MSFSDILNLVMRVFSLLESIIDRPTRYQVSKVSAWYQVSERAQHRIAERRSESAEVALSSL